MKNFSRNALYLLVFLLPLQTRNVYRIGSLNNGYWEYGTISLYATDILLLVLLVLSGIILILNRKENKTIFKASRLFYLSIAFTGAVLVSIAFADNKILALYKSAWLVMGIGLSWVAAQADYSRAKLIGAFLAGVFLTGALGIWQFLTQSTPTMHGMGMAVHDPWELGTSVVEAVGADGIGERWLRAYGTLDHPNMLGGLLALGILIIFYLRLDLKKPFLCHSRESGNPGVIAQNEIPACAGMTKGENAGMKIINADENNNSFKLLILVSYLLLLTFTAGLFFTFSRAAWVACALGIIAYFILVISQKNSEQFWNLLKMAFGIVLMFVVLSFSFSNLFLARARSSTRLEQKSNQERMDSDRAALEIIRESKFLGVGIGNYTLALAKLKPGLASYSYQPAHNGFLLIAAEIGLFGLVIFLALSAYLSSFLWNANRLMLPLALALLALAFFDHWLWSLHFGVLLIFFTVGLILRIKVTD